MKKIFLLIIYSQFLFSQNNNQKVNNLCIKTNPLSLIDIYGSYSYRIGLEAKVYKNFAFSVEYGNYFNYGKDDGIRLNSKGFIFKPELKYYENQNVTGNYVSLEYTYKDIAYDWKDTIPTAENPKAIKKYRISKSIYSFNAKVGYLKVYKNNIIFEGFVGLGIRISNGSNTLSENEQNNIVSFDESEINMAQKNVNYIYPNLSIGIKIGYRFF